MAEDKPAPPPRPINVNDYPSESLPVYTEKKWEPNEDAVPDQMIKDEPSIAKLEQGKANNSNYIVFNDQKTNVALFVQKDSWLVDKGQNKSNLPEIKTEKQKETLHVQ